MIFRMLIGLIIVLLVALGAQQFVNRGLGSKLKAAQDRVTALQGAYQVSEASRVTLSNQLRRSNEVLVAREKEQNEILIGISNIKRKLADAYKKTTPVQIECADTSVPDVVTGVLQYYGASHPDSHGDPATPRIPSD